MSGKGKGKEVERCGEDGESHGKLKESEGHDVELPPDVVACGGIGEPDIAEDGDYELDRYCMGSAPTLRKMTDRELTKYMGVFYRSGGYDLPSMSPDCYSVGGPLILDPKNDKNREDLELMAKLAIGKYNEEQGTRLELKRVKKAILGPGTFRYYITLDILDPEDDAKRTKVFQATLDQTASEGVYTMVEVRRKPTAKTKGQDPKPTAKTTTSRKRKGQWVEVEVEVDEEDLSFLDD